MKRNILLTFLLAFTLAFASCTSTGSAQGSSSTGAAASKLGISLSQSEISQATKLALGTMELDQTALAVDSEQAAQLLILWKAARSLSESNTTASQEIDALLKQIQNTMTSDQLNALEGMNLNSQAISAVVANGDASGTTVTGNTVPAQPASPSGGMEAGPMPAGGGDLMGQLVDPGISPTTNTGNNSGTSSVMLDINPVLLNTLIQFLEAKAA
jgi:hypothetical protein